MKYVLIVAWVSFAGLVAFADVTWHHNETVTVDADINDDIYLEGTVYVKVVGGTRCLTGVIREVPGKVGKIVVVQGKLQFRKQGVGPAENEPANEYSGGVEVRGSGSVATRGTASATSSTPEKAMPFGTGLLLCDRSGAGYPMLEWMGTIANDVLCTGATSWEHPFLDRHGGTGCLGDITVQGDCYIIAYTGRPDGTMGNAKMGFGKSLTVRTDDGQKHDFYFNGSTMYNLQCPVVARVMDAAQRYDSKGNQICESHYPGMIGGFYLGSKFKDSDVDLIRVNQGWLQFGGDGVGNGAYGVEFYGGLPTRMYLTAAYSGWEIGKEVNGGIFVVNYEGNKNVPTTTVWTQTIKWLNSDYRDDTEPNYVIRRQNGAYPFNVDLKFTGEPNRTCCAYMAIKDRIGIVLDAPKTFTQIFSNRTHSITRPITVKGGTLEFANCTFQSIGDFSVAGGGTLRFRGGDTPTLPEMLVLDGSLELIGEGAAPQMPDAIVVSNGVFALEGFDRVTNTISSVELSGENAALNFPKGSILTVNSYVVDGVPQRDGDYLLDGVTIQARGGVFPTTETAVWVGQGLDNLFKTAANWEYGELPTFDETLNAIISKSGNDVKVWEDATVGALQITNAGPIEVTHPITLEGAVENHPEKTKLTVYGQMNLLFDRAQLTLKDITIATPYGFNQGEPTRLGEKTFTILTTNRNDWALVPITLHNAVIEKPVYMRTAADGENKASVLMHVDEGTYNEFKGSCWKETANWASILIQPDATLCFSGGFKSGYKWNVYTSAGSTFWIKNKPWTSTSGGNACVNFGGQTGTSNGGGHVIFDAEDNYFGYDIGEDNWQAGLTFAPGADQTYHVDMLRNGACRRVCLRTQVTGRKYVEFDFHSTTQTFWCIKYNTGSTTSCVDTNDAQRCYFTGEQGAILEVSNYNGTDKYKSSTMFHFRGAIGVMKSKPGVFTIERSAARKAAGLNNDCTSTGPLIVNDGELVLGEGVTWRHCSAVELNGGEFRVTEDLALGREAVCNIKGGKISVPQGKTLWFSGVSIDGVPVLDGDYTKATVGNPFADYMTGDCEGMIRVCQRGFILIYR